MSDCSNAFLAPYDRCEIRIVFTDHQERDFMLPINLMNRSIDHFEADGIRYVRARERDWDDCGVID